MRLLPSTSRLTRRVQLRIAAWHAVNAVLAVLTFAMPSALSMRAPAQAASRASITSAVGRTVELGHGRKMYIVCAGPVHRGEPTVVLVGGYHDSADPWTDNGLLSLLPQATGPAVFPGLARAHHVCAYDRPGSARYQEGLPLTTRTTPVRQPRTAADLVSELHRLLVAARVPEGYVLVGHSLGGLITLLYARTYPSETRGAVFVDALSPTLPKVLGPRLWPLYRLALNPPASRQPVSTLKLPTAERVDFDESISQVERAPKLRAIPLAVITKTEPFRIPASFLPPGLTLQAASDGYNTAEKYFVELSPSTPHIFATGSEHYIHLSQPDLVITTTELVLRRAMPRSKPH